MPTLPLETKIPSNALFSHQAAVSRIAERVQTFYALQKPFRLFHGSTNSTRASNKTRDNIIDTRPLNHVLLVDPETRTALAEPNVSMAQLVETTTKYGLLPPVVMEFPGITVGGGFSGTSAESSSFKHGFFDRTINWIEMVCANGDVVTADHDQNPDLFYGAASSFGTLGVTVLLQIQLVEAKRFVDLSYIPVTSMGEALDVIEEASTNESIDYVDGIFYSRTKGVVCTGRLTSSVIKSEDLALQDMNIQHFLRPSDPWFYQHARKAISPRSSKSMPRRDLIPVADYLFRYDRGGFWVAKYSFMYFLTPFNRFTRFLLDSFLHASVMFHALHKSDLAQSYLVQDVAVPYNAAEEFLDFVDRQWGRYPIWLCPLLQKGQPPLFSKGAPSTSSLSSKNEEKSMHRSPDMMLNFGIWGPTTSPRTPNYFSRRTFAELNRQIEHKVHDAGGQKCLYAHAYYTEKEFWDVYDKAQYDALRAKWHAGYLPSVWDKVKVDVEKEDRKLNESWSVWLWFVFWSIWPLAGVYGVLHTILKKDYLLKRK